MTAHELKAAERAYQLAARRADEKRHARDQMILQALDAGMTKAAAARATGLGRARIGQIARGYREIRGYDGTTEPF